MNQHCDSVSVNGNFVMVKINGKNTRALIDSGSSVTAISEEFFYKLKVPIHCLQRSDVSRLVSANRSPLINLGNVELHINLQGVLLNFVFCVI